MITPAQRAEIRRLYYAEHWKIGTIAAQLGLHRETVRAAVERESPSVPPSVWRSSIIDPYLPFIRDTLTQYPRLRATRIHEMVRQRGYAGSVFPVRKLVRRLRPETSRAVYRRVVTLAGESAQVDWGSFGKVRIGQGTRTVSGFVMVLGYSRALAALFTLDQTLESFLRGHVAAFDALGGAARNLVYDNLRSAVLDRRGAAVQFHPRLLELAGHYHFAPRPCTPGRGNEKGKVERQIQYLRHAYFAARRFRDLDDINAQFRRWRDEVAHRRPHPDQPNRSVADVWAEEKPRLLPLPANPFETDLVRAVRSGKTPYVRFDRNLYSIPHTHVRKPLTLVASATRIRILDGQTELANHHRTYDTGLTVEDPAHLEGLLAATRQANVHTTRDRLRAAVPELAGHYHFAPRPCTPGRGNEKGKVERQIQYLRHAYFAARRFRDLDDINAQFRRWRDEVAHRRPHPDQPNRSVADVWAEEKPRLLPLPANPFETDLVRAVRSGKTPYVRFDRNLYSIPHTHVRKPLTLVASATRIRILDGQTELANHHRTYDTGLTVEDPAHLEGLLAATRQANVHTTRDRLRAAVPNTSTLFERLAERGEALRPHATRLLALLDDYGPQELAAAVDIALQRDALGAGSITHILETRRRQRGLKPPLRLTLPDRPGLRDLDVRPHDLETYDALGQKNPDDAGD